MACDAPIWIKYDYPRWDPGKQKFVEHFPADCGKCLKCLNKRKSQWSYRIMEEKRNSFSSYFVTLTYNNMFVPHGDSGYTLNGDDHKKFIKWLKYFEDPKRLKSRKDITLEELKRIENGVKAGQKLKYFGAQEYGDEFGRPHMHYILFNVHDTRNISNAWSEIVRISKGNYLPGRSKGKVDIDECNVNTVDYTLKYMIKAPKDGEFEDKAKEKSYMSKGIGTSVVDAEFIRYIRDPRGNQVTNTRGHKVALPRYFNKKYLNDEERELKAQRIRQEVEKERQKRREFLERNGVDPDQQEFSEKEIRFKSMKNRKRREIKDYEKGNSNGRT